MPTDGARDSVDTTVDMPWPLFGVAAAAAAAEELLRDEDILECWIGKGNRKVRMREKRE